MSIEPEREALAEKLSFLLWDRGNSVNEWPHDEAEAYREFGWAEGVAAARKIMFQNAADDLISAGYRRQPEPREVTTVDSCDVPIWDPFQMPCGYAIVNGRCVRHGAVRFTMAHQSPPPGLVALPDTPAPPTPAKPADGRTEPLGENA